MLRSGAGSTLTAKRLESCADRKGLSLWVERWGRHAQTIKLGGNQVSELNNKNACIFRHSGSDLQTLRFIDATGWREHKPRLSSSSSSLLSSDAQYSMTRSAVPSGNGRPTWSLQRNNVDNACLRSVIRLGRTQTERDLLDTYKLLCPHPLCGGIKRWCCLTSVCLSDVCRVHLA